MCIDDVHVRTYLTILDDLTADTAHVPRLCDVLQYRGYQTEYQYQQIGDGQVYNKQIGHSAHVPVHADGEADEKVSDESDEEHQRVEQYQYPLVGVGKYERVNNRQVILVADAVSVRAGAIRCRSVVIDEFNAAVIGVISCEADVIEKCSRVLDYVVERAAEVCIHR